MIKIGIIGAMESEIEIFKSQIKNLQTTMRQGKVFYTGQLQGKEVVLTQSGIGKVHAALSAQTLIGHFEVSHLINSGVAGAISDQLKPGDVVISTDLVYHDVDVTGFGYPAGQIPGVNSPFFEADKQLVILGSVEDVHVGRIATGDQFINNNAKKEEIRTTFDPLCVEMEGAAVAHVCHLSHTPFVVIRAISDAASGDAEEAFETNLETGVARATAITTHIIAKL